MSLLGSDAGGGWFRRLQAPSNPAGLGLALLFAVLLIVLNQALQYGLAAIAVKTLFGGTMDNVRDAVKASLLVIFPASLLTAAAAIYLAGRRGGWPTRVLSLRWPRLSLWGWAALTFGFMAAMYLAIALIVLGFGIDLAQYTPGPDGQTPKSGSTGLVKEAMFDIANEPLLFLAVLPSLALGAPIAEEFIFRGQLFSALSLSRLGVTGATLVTASAWALMHMSEPWLSIGLIFVMGLLFGWMIYRFGSLWITMACHGMWNSVFALAIFANSGGQS